MDSTNHYQTEWDRLLGDIAKVRTRSTKLAEHRAQVEARAQAVASALGRLLGSAMLPTSRGGLEAVIIEGDDSEFPPSTVLIQERRFDRTIMVDVFDTYLVVICSEEIEGHPRYLLDDEDVPLSVVLEAAADVIRAHGILE